MREGTIKLRHQDLEWFRNEALLPPNPLPEYPTRDFTMSTSSLQAKKTIYTLLTLFFDRNGAVFIGRNTQRSLRAVSAVPDISGGRPLGYGKITTLHLASDWLHGTNVFSRQVTAPVFSVGNSKGEGVSAAGIKQKRADKCIDKEYSINNIDNDGIMGSVESAASVSKPNVPKILNFRTLVNEEKVENADIVLPWDAIDKVTSEFENSLVGYFIGKSLAFQIVQIYVSSDSDLKKEVTMVVPNEDETGYTREVISVEYEWQPPRCTDYKNFGHSSNRCPKIVREHVASIFKNTNSDGFTKVKRKKYKDKKADLQPRSRQIEGIRLNMLKPNLYWQKKGTVRKGVEIDSTIKDINKVNGPSTSKYFDALNTMDVEDECGTSSSRGSQQEEHEARLNDPQLNEHDKFDEEGDEFIFPEGDKFGDKFDVRLKGRVRK
uniref:DUF4283 domain-containing protein n=1 Tax=Tanacetum cinerariifolium TaxID=118510 RepID=A0A6L2J366_TANCI|nr:hypothetical protein [Tanacetum cinerariifolium]